MCTNKGPISPRKPCNATHNLVEGVCLSSHFCNKNPGVGVALPSVVCSEGERGPCAKHFDTACHSNKACLLEGQGKLARLWLLALVSVVPTQQLACNGCILAHTQLQP